MDPHHHNYLASLAYELTSQAKRVRDLIGDKHWLTDGHHHEAVLAEVIKRHLGANFLATRGFILDPVNHSECSTEQDLLVIDVGTQSPIFLQHGTAISRPDQTLAAISIKATMTKATLKEAFNGLASAKRIAKKIVNPKSQLWCAAFFFEVSQTLKNNPHIVLEYIEDAVSNTDYTIQEYIPDLTCTSKHFAVGVRRDVKHDGVTVYAKNYDELSSAVLLGGLMDHISRIHGTPAQLCDMLDEVDAPSIGDPLQLM